MEVKDFARWVKKNNDSDCRKSIFAEAGFAGLAFLYALFGDDNGSGIFMYRRGTYRGKGCR